MNISSPFQNPFKVLTPESMTAAEVHAQFVIPFSDFNKICELGHTIVHGPRGCGKSMIFRYLLPDCQCLATEKSLNHIHFLAFLISIKNTIPNLTEFRRLEDKHAENILNEHLLVIFTATKIYQSLATLNLPDSPEALAEVKKYYSEIFSSQLRKCGGEIPNPPNTLKTAKEMFHFIMETCNGIYSDVVQYIRRLALTSDMVIPYKSALCGYTDFLLPVLTSLREISFLPKGPIYLLIDDADYLNEPQTLSLNSWVSTRTQGNVSIKISTQFRYKTYQTSYGLPIQSPHDYQSINIADIYTTKRGRYLDRVEEIIGLRLKNAGIKASPREFFPTNEKQEAAISERAEKIKSEWLQNKRGFRPSDDALRYARPEYIRSLSGQAKSKNTYSYSGFDHLVHISSGLVRYFLEPAAVMYDEQISSQPNKPVVKIDHSIQNKVVRAEADRLMFSEFNHIRSQNEAPKSEMDKLFNLISWLGGTFSRKLLSDDSERRVFSIALSGAPNQEIEDIFDLGVRYSYFHRSSIGKKDGTGRTRLYVLTRRLAPHFSLDPTSFAGYLWATPEILRESMLHPNRVLNRMKKSSVDDTLESGQLNLFDD